MAIDAAQSDGLHHPDAAFPRSAVPQWTVEAMDGVASLFDPFDEGCGFLVGLNGTVVRVVAARNMWGTKPWHERSGRRANSAFSIGRAQFEAAEKDAMADGLTMMGVIHTHLFEDAIPSSYDFSYLAKYRPGGIDCLWHIVSGDLVMYGHDALGWPEIKARAIIHPTPLMRAATAPWCEEPWDRHILPRPRWEHALRYDPPATIELAREVATHIRRRKNDEAKRWFAQLTSLLD